MQPQKILDIDLDFFQTERVTDFGGRHSGQKGNRPWSEGAVRNFIQNNLKIDQKVKGRIVEKHDGAFKFWKELIDKKKLTKGFVVDHIDAHSDLGYGNSAWSDLLNIYMGKFWDDRDNIPIKDMNEGNYLIYALAMNWIVKLRYIHHPTSNSDLLTCWFKEFDTDSGIIQINQFDGLGGMDFGSYKDVKNKIIQFGNEIAFDLINGNSYVNTEKPDYVVLSISKDYLAPKTIDLLPIFEEIIDCI